jgi:hypothetical protein
MESNQYQDSEYTVTDVQVFLDGQSAPIFVIKTKLNITLSATRALIDAPKQEESKQSR